MSDAKCSCGHQTDQTGRQPQAARSMYNMKPPDEDMIFINPITLASINTTNYEPAMKIAQFHCNCKYLWLRELHGLSAFMMSNSLMEKIFWAIVIMACAGWSIVNTAQILKQYEDEATTTLLTILPAKQLKFPTMIFCPRNPDFINYYNVLEDMYNHLGYMENKTNFHVLQYAMTGFGFDNADGDTFNETYREKIHSYYMKWRDNRTQYEMFDFMYNKNGYTCQDMFQTCYGGSLTYNCCDIFQPTYAMLRGRCFRLMDDYYQNDTDEVSKVSIFFNNMTSPILNSGVLPQLVLYNGDSNIEVGIYPRYYLNSNDWNRIRFYQKSMILLPKSDGCSTEPVYQGKFTCFVYKWLMQLIDQYNCTLPYLKDVPICEPDVIVDNFANISLTPSTIGYKCTPACSRIENTVQLTTSIDYDPDPSYMFRIEASFTYLEYEQYKEIRTTSTAGFISELGGQAGLFVGSSIMSFVQLFNSIFIQIYKLLRNYCNKKGIRVRIGLYETHPSVPADKHYDRDAALSDEPPYPLETILEVEGPQVMDADGMLLESGEPVSELEAIELETWSSKTSSFTDDSAYYPTPSFSSSEPHSTISESPEDVRLAQLVWIRQNTEEEI
ncbi:hypothetical protein GCK72_014854 [Caenorhabditis remanei]|uniref:Uncharacterized protein n=1 Tax=Caenorhabditis remanei TaxID=31234 RepID=A0A6A5GUV8_CAERE|nr:hypothetical protein GCK72_014854 [Caenorhabditis remanei]KAF1758396.1 hypothetical protein GCK72_014854 [Caenorhabditis remanei]